MGYCGDATPTSNSERCSVFRMHVDVPMGELFLSW